MKLRRSRLTVQQTERLLEHFVAGTPARTSAELVGVNRNTATHFYHRLREMIAERLESLSPLATAGSWQRSESSFGDTEKCATGSSANAGVVVLGLLVRGRKVYTVVLPHTERDVALPRLRASTNREMLFHVETIDIGDLLDVPGRRQRQRSRGERVRGRLAHFGSVENFQRQVRRNLRRYNGVPMHHFHLFLKECEWRFNYGSPRQLLATLMRWLAERD